MFAGRKRRTREFPVRQKRTGGSRRTEQRRSEVSELLLSYCDVFCSICMNDHSYMNLFSVAELLRRKDEQIISLLEEKVHIFRDLGDCNHAPDDTNPSVRERMLFRATPDDVTKGEPIIRDALREGEQMVFSYHVS